MNEKREAEAAYEEACQEATLEIMKTQNKIAAARKRLEETRGTR